MKCVYEASTGLDAHMILNLLEQRRISGRIEGEYLQGGIGELSAMGFVRVLVEDEDYTAAKLIISEWEAIQLPEEKPKPETSASIALRIFITGVFVGGVIMYWLMKVLAA
jgi:putative signal transducing protein